MLVCADRKDVFQLLLLLSPLNAPFVALYWPACLHAASMSANPSVEALAALTAPSAHHKPHLTWILFHLCFAVGLDFVCHDLDDYYSHLVGHVDKLPVIK